MQIRSTILILLLAACLQACVEEVPEPVVDFDIIILQDTQFLVEGSGFDDGFEPGDNSNLFANTYGETDIITFRLRHEGELQEIVPIDISITGSATEGVDFPIITENTFIYNPYRNTDENQITLRINDDLEYEGSVPETLQFEFSYLMDGEKRIITREVSILDNEFRFEVTWNNEINDPASSVLEMGVRRNNGPIFFDLGDATMLNDNTFIFDLSGNINKWQPLTGYGIDLQYLDKTQNTGRVSYTAKLHLPDGQTIEYSDFFEEDDYQSETTNYHLPFVIESRYDFGTLELRSYFKDGLFDIFYLDVGGSF